jgi:hypothetical protein
MDLLPWETQKLTSAPDRNTTLPHPDADTSPNATIEAPDDLTRIHSRNSFLHRRPHSKNSFGKIDPMKGLYDNLKYADRIQEVENTKALAVKLLSTESPANGASQQNGVIDGGIDERPANGYGNGAASAPVNGYTKGHKRAESGYSNGEKKKSLFKRLSLHR